MTTRAKRGGSAASRGASAGKRPAKKAAGEARATKDAKASGRKAGNGGAKRSANGARKAAGTTRKGRAGAAASSAGAATRTRLSGGEADEARAAVSKPAPSRANGSPAGKTNGARVDALTPVAARPRRSERAEVDARLSEIDEVCTAWADIVAERVSADQTFADLVEQLAHQPPRDLRGLFLWDALQAAESHVALVNEVLAAHLRDRRADPVVILAELRRRQRRIAAVYAVNAFLAVLNQMRPQKPKWLAFDDLDPRFAVLALAHQTLGYALEAAQVEAPPDVTDHILTATQDDAVWVWRRMPEPGTETLAACAAAAAFFRGLGADVLTTTDEVAALYAEHAHR